MPDQPSEASGEAGSAFEEFINGQFGPDPAPRFSEPVAPLGVFLCFVNRSGSNFLASCLASSGEFPRAREFFLNSNLLGHAEDGSGLSGVFETIVGKHCRNGVFAAKLGHSQLTFFETSGFLDAAFGRKKFLLLERRDILSQAISLEIARQSRRWKSGETGAEDLRPEYSRKRLELKMGGIRRKYARFRTFFAGHRLDRHRITYEDLADDPAETVAAAGEFLGIPLRFVPERIDLKKSPGSELKQSWKQRFLAGD